MMEHKRASLPVTFVYDRALYAGGATFAALLRPFFYEYGGFHHNYSDGKRASIRGLRPGDAVPSGTAECVREEDVNFLWGLNMRRRMANWPKPTKYITVLRHPVLRFISIVRSTMIYDEWNSFWESELWDGDNAIERLGDFVDRYAQLRPQWARSQCTELMDRIDYAGMECLVRPEVYPDNADPLLEEDGVAKAIQFMEQNFSDVYILELQEEAVLHFAMKYGFRWESMKLSPVERHKHYKRWDEMDIPRAVIEKIEKLVDKELQVYTYFRKKFDEEFEKSISPELTESYLKIKFMAIVIDPKMVRHFLGGDSMYLPRLVFEDRRIMDNIATAIHSIKRPSK